MTTMFRLVSLFILAILASHVWSFAATTPNIYDYDAGRYLYYTQQGIKVEGQIQNYDSKQNLSNPVDPLQAESTDAKPRIEASFAFIDGLFVTKSTKALPSLQVPNAGGKIVSDVTKQDEVFFPSFF